MRQNKRKVFLLLITAMFLAGCWDRVDIEERGFIVGTAIDFVDQKSENKYEVMMTNQFVIPSGLGSITQGGKGQKAFMNVSRSGVSLFRTNRKFSQINSQVPFYQHLKVLVISSEILEIPHLFSDVMDFYIRDHAMRRSIRLVVTEGEANEILELKPENVDVPAMYLDDLMESTDKNTSTIKPTHIGEVQEQILNQQSYVLPVIKREGFLAEYGGVVVIKGETNQMVGALNEDETSGLGFMDGSTEGGVLEIEVDGELVAVEIMEIQQKLKMEGKKLPNVKADINIEIKGNIAEHFGVESVLEEKYVQKIERAAEAKVKELTTKTIEKAQQELHTDFLGISKTLYESHYDFWQKVKDNWGKGENYFSNATIQIKPNVEIDRVGSSDRIKMQEGE
ncbi:Ger(x)C family spore germination protein [Oceanobacillus kapialis]|uniref:Ger(X)C family spore germination protein n=1 Tax=Oceanobacillus kapialis TaxID=481353 RepID=A0ABW5Q1Y2_9BACI